MKPQTKVTTAISHCNKLKLLKRQKIPLKT